MNTQIEEQNVLNFALDPKGHVLLQDNQSTNGQLTSQPINNENQLQVFESAEFGELEIIMIDGKPYFPATRCAEILGYREPQKATRVHCTRVSKLDTRVQTGIKSDGTPAIQIVRKSYITDLHGKESVLKKIKASRRNGSSDSQPFVM